MGFQKKIDTARRELLDLSLRNPLLNYRTLKKKGLNITDEKSLEIYKLLVENGKSMSFLCEDTLIEDAETPEHLELLNKSYSDLKIQTRYSEKELQDRLLNTQLTAKTIIEERGVNTLFLALGMLLWEEEGGSGKKYRAPMILVPVTLNRSNARERFLLSYTGEDIQFNVSLAAKLINDFSIDIEYEMEEFDIISYFQHISDAIVSRPSWEVLENEIALGFFSFGKYLMYLDLDSSRWPTDSRFFNNDILKALLVDGFTEERSEISDDSYIDPHLKPDENYLVVDADSSQTLAILDINSGRNLVVQGPPGTGKSQTITNIIAECVARGKKVLFVSEKLAALEVVKRRLANVGLGDVCLELHSQKANKKDLLAELQKTLELGAPKIDELDSKFNEYVNLRNELTNYCNCINEPVLPSGLALIRIFGKLIYLQKTMDKNGVQLPRISISDIDKLNDVDFEAKLAKVKELQNHIRKMGVPENHPFWGSGLSVVLPSKKDAIYDKVKNLRTAFENFIFVLDEVGSLLNYNASNLKDADRLAQSLDIYINRPDITGFDIKSPLWDYDAVRIKDLISNGMRLKKIYEKNKNQIMDEIYRQDLLWARQSIAANKDKFLKFLSSDYKKAEKLVTGFFRTPVKMPADKLLEIADDVLEFNRLKDTIENSLPQYQELFPEHAKGYWDTNWLRLKTVSDYIIQLHEGITNKKYISEIITLINNSSVMEQAVKLVPALKDSLKSFPEALEQFNLEAEMKQGMGINKDSDSFTVISEIISNWDNGIESVYDIATFNQYAIELNKLGLAEIVRLSEEWNYAGEYLSYVLENERYQALLTKAYRERPELARFDSTQHQRKIERFNELDLSLMSSNIPRLLYEHWKNKPNSGNGNQGQLGVLYREFQKKTRHMPIRKLMTRAGNVIQALKPVMMMSPLSIANFIEPGQLSFDIVVFDEASQVRPVEAFGALMRSKQAVVVGDSQQMPPSDFFDKTINADTVDEEEDYVGDVESILGLFLAQNAPQRMLRWHYRSRHESLITVSNKEFYKNRLVVFPSCVQQAENMGLVFHHLKDSIYDRGNTQTNPEEARIVAEHVMRHAKEHPELTLGVAAFSINQMQAIIDNLEIMRRVDPSAESFFQSHPEEPFFVKNLENVQGDERDVIFISIGYGRDKDGVMTMSFGPLNRDGGERRLNVLITRARQKCEVFSSITGDDIDLSRTQSRGVACLKTFLTFAEKGTMDLPVQTDREVESEFERQVYDMLVEKGYTVHQQVGCADFYIDLAVVHPEEPGKYLLGIECDGASYHSARSSKDRDRLRQAALERKGWNIYRIWSTDWFKSPKTEIEKLEQYINQLIENKEAPSNIKIMEPEPVTVEREASLPPSDSNDTESNIEKYQVYQGRSINDELIYQPAFLSRLIYDILSVESPMHKEELIRRVLGLTGVSRAGNRVQNSFEVAVSHNIRRGIISERNNFLYRNDMEIKLRSRSDLPAASKKFDYIPPEEIALAIKTVIKSSYGMNQQEIPLSVAKLLGFARTTEDITEKVNAVLKQLENNNEIQKQGDTFIIT